MQNRSSATVPSGKVISTEPSQGVPLLAGSPVTVFVSTGPPQVEVPKVTGQSEAEARGSLRAAGLDVGAVTKREEAGQAAGTVLSQLPSAGSSVRSGEAVSLVVAKASQEIAVPRVVGKKQERAEGELIGRGLRGEVEHANRLRAMPKSGWCSSRPPPGGAKAKRGATITLTVGELAAQTTPSTTTRRLPAPPPPPPRLPRRRAGGGRLHEALVALLAGGRSSEHDVSLASARAVREGLAHAGHEVRWVEIARDGGWCHAEEPLTLLPGRGLLDVDVVFPALHGPFGEDGTVQGMLESLDVAYVGAGSRPRRSAWTRCSSKS